VFAGDSSTGSSPPQAGDARRLAKNVEEGLADDTIARVGAMVRPLEPWRKYPIERNFAECTRGGRRFPSIPFEGAPECLRQSVRQKRAYDDEEKASDPNQYALLLARRVSRLRLVVASRLVIDNRSLTGRGSADRRLRWRSEPVVLLFRL
jgi:hypothetical protein